MTEWQRYETHGFHKSIERDGELLNIFVEEAGSPDGPEWVFELFDSHYIQRRRTISTVSSVGVALKAAEEWAADQKTYSGYWGGWNTWHLQLENDNDQTYYNDYMDLVREYNDALADNPDFNQESIREALSRHLLQIITHSDADYVLHHIDFDELWEVFLSNAKEAREYDDKR